MQINIYTDASYYHENGTGAYAYFIYGDTVHTGFGTLTNLENSNDAELHAIYMALCNLLLIYDGEICIFWTDSFHSIKILERPQKKWYPITNKMNPLLKKIHYNFNYAPRNSLPELWWCDQKCKELT